MNLGDILDILNCHTKDLRLASAVTIAAQLIELHNIQVSAAYGEGHTEGYQAGLLSGRSETEKIDSDVKNKAFDDGYNIGYANGKRDGDLGEHFERITKIEMARLRRLEEMVTSLAKEHVKEVVRTVGSKKKIQCIKELRNRYGTGLKETKDIVDDYVRKLDNMMLASWERELLDASYR